MLLVRGKEEPYNSILSFIYKKNAVGKKTAAFLFMTGVKKLTKTKLDKNNCKLIYTKETQAKIKFDLIKLCNNIKIIRKPLYFSKNKK